MMQKIKSTESDQSDQKYIEQKIIYYLHGSFFDKLFIDNFINHLYNDDLVINKKMIQHVINKYIRYSKKRNVFYFDINQIKKNLKHRSKKNIDVT